MTVDAMVLVYCIGAAALALWFDQRFPRLAPSDLRGALVRLVVVMVVGWLGIPVMGNALEAGASPVGTLLVLVLPVLTLSFVAAIWVIRTVQGMLPGLRR